MGDVDGNQPPKASNPDSQVGSNTGGFTTWYVAFVILGIPALNIAAIAFVIVASLSEDSAMRLRAFIVLFPLVFFVAAIILNMSKQITNGDLILTVVVVVLLAIANVMLSSAVPFQIV